MYLFRLLFRVQEHGVMMCCVNLIFMRFCFIYLRTYQVLENTYPSKILMFLLGYFPQIQRLASVSHACQLSILRGKRAPTNLDTRPFNSESLR